MHSEGRYGVERGLVGWWRLMDSNEGVNDIIGTNNGTLNGGMGYGSGGGRRYAVFDGTDDYMQTGNVSYTAGDPYTLSLWAYRSADGTYMVMTSQATYPSEGITILLDEAPHKNEITFFITGYGAAGYVSSGVVMAVDRWYHIALTFDGTTCRFYVDAVEEVTSTNVRPTRNETFQIGRWYNGLSLAYWNGRISDHRHYNRALSAAEVARLARVY